jgi:hypothetical protein
MAWGMVILNLVLFGLLATMHSMAAMWLMAVIMFLDAAFNLFMQYHHSH